MTKEELFNFLKSELLEFKQEDIEIENCKIKGTNLGLENNDIMSLDIYLESDGWGASFGSYRMDGAYGMACLRELLETLEVSKYEDLKGMYVRCIDTGLGGRCLAIGHLLKDRWFSFEAFFNAHKDYKDSENGVEASTDDLSNEQIYELQCSERDYCEMYEPTYNPEDGSM